MAIDSWFPGPKAFYPAVAEGICYRDFDKAPNDPDNEECEVFIQRRIPPLSTVVFRIFKDMSKNIALNASTTDLKLANNYYKV